jgi:hypothetical protein
MSNAGLSSSTLPRTLTRDLACAVDLARNLNHGFISALDLARSIDLARMLALDLGLDLTRNLHRARNLDKEFISALDVDIAFVNQRDIIRAHALVRDIIRAAELAAELAAADDHAGDVARDLHRSLVSDFDHHHGQAGEPARVLARELVSSLEVACSRALELADVNLGRIDVTRRQHGLGQGVSPAGSLLTVAIRLLSAEQPREDATCRPAGCSAAAAAVDSEQRRRNLSVQDWRLTGQPATHASAQHDDRCPQADADNDAAVAAYRLSVQVGNPFSERKLAQNFGRTSRRWARARIAEARQSLTECEPECRRV